MKRAFIFAAGSFFGLRERPVSSDLIIAADAGEQACRQAGLTPHLLLGDFDSMPPPENPEVPLVRLPTEKDDTDTLEQELQTLVSLLVWVMGTTELSL